MGKNGQTWKNKGIKALTETLSDDNSLKLMTLADFHSFFLLSSFFFSFLVLVGTLQLQNYVDITLIKHPLYLVHLL